jgi:hypothetical protein
VGVVMGWKNVKEYYRLDYLVQVRRDGRITIGTTHYQSMIEIGADSRIISYFNPIDDHVDRCVQEMLADPEKLKELILTPDTFSVSIPVYSCIGSKIIKEFCEKLGYPNVTHEGYLMLDAAYSTDIEELVRRTKKHKAREIGDLKKQLGEKKQEMETLKKDLANIRKYLPELLQDLAKLQFDYPDGENTGTEC